MPGFEHNPVCYHSYYVLYHSCCILDRRLQQDALTDPHGFLDDMCAVADAVPLAPLLQGGTGGAGDEAAAAGRAHAMAAQQAQTAALLARVAQVPFRWSGSHNF